MSGLIILNVLLKTHGILNDQEKTKYRKMMQETSDVDGVLKAWDYDLTQNMNEPGFLSVEKGLGLKRMAAHRKGDGLCADDYLESKSNSDDRFRVSGVK